MPSQWCRQANAVPSLSQAIIVSGSARNSQRFLAHCTRGIVLLGTPHRGSKASLQARVARIVRQCSGDKQSLQLQQRRAAPLPPGRASGMWDQLGAFGAMADKFAIAVECFYETPPSSRACSASSAKVSIAGRPPCDPAPSAYFPGWQAVDEPPPALPPPRSASVAVAAVATVASERSYMLTTSHADMGRFASASDPNLACIVTCLKRLCADPKDTAQLGSPPSPPPSFDAAVV